MKKLLFLLLALTVSAPAFAQTQTQYYTVPTIAALKAMTTSRPAVVQVVDANPGIFNLSQGACSAADDIFQVQPTSGTTVCYTRMNGNRTPVTATGGSTVQSLATRFGQVLSAKDFGALCDGSTNDTVALQAGIDAFPYGGTLRIPVGTCRFTTLTGAAGVFLVGDDPYASVLQTTVATGTLITLPTSSGLVNLKLSSSVARTAGFHADISGNGVTIDNVEFDEYYIAVNVGTLAGPIVVYPRILNSAFRTPAITSGAGGIQFIHFSNAVVSGVVMTGPTSGDQPAFGVRFQNGDTAFVDNTNVTLHGRGLLIDPAVGYNSYAISITNGVFDSAGTVLGGNVSSAVIQPAGGVYNTKISNSWFGLSTGAFGLEIAPTGAGVVDGTTCTGCEFMANGDGGFIANGTGVLNTTITGGQSGGNTNEALRFAGATTRFTVTGHRAGNVSARGPNGTGISIDNATAADWYLIQSNSLEGNTLAALFDGGTGTNKRIGNNLGSTVVGGPTYLATLYATGQVTSTLSPGTAPFVVASTTNVANLNASSLNGATFAAPGAIGGGTRSTGAFTTLSATGALTYGGVTLSNSVTGTGSMVLSTTPVVQGSAQLIAAANAYSLELRGRAADNISILAFKSNNNGLQYGTITGTASAITLAGVPVTVSDNLTSTGTIRANTAFSANGTAGTSATISVRKGDDSGACNVVVTFGLVTSHTC